MAQKRDFTFGSNDGKTKIHGIRWTPETGEVKAVLQIVHGMIEFIERYDEFAGRLAEQGILVVGHDHLGHGTSVVSGEEYGYFAEKNGNQILLADIHKLRKRTEKKYPKVPYFIMGHSMGSFLLRQYLCIHGEGLAGAIIMGTGTQQPAALKAGRILCRLLAGIRGWHYRSRLVDRMVFGGYNKRFQPARTGSDWLTKEQEIVDRYRADERRKFRFTLNGYDNLFLSIQEASSLENMKRMPKKLPILFASGAEDPVGQYGKGVEQVRRQFQAVGMEDVTWLLYENDRHEILNETDRETVYKDLYAWLYVRIAQY